MSETPSLYPDSVIKPITFDYLVARNITAADIMDALLILNVRELLMDLEECVFRLEFIATDCEETPSGTYLFIDDSCGIFSSVSFALGRLDGTRLPTASERIFRYYTKNSR